MTLLLPDDRLGERRAAARGGLAPLTESLAADLARVLEREVHPPAEKAHMSVRGGRCEVDRTPLAFDPFDGGVHRCPRCGRSHEG
ncbi:MAG: hypothetical protein ACJ8AO_11770, partial [Gemmatimonadaceae bacterium]